MTSFIEYLTEKEGKKGTMNYKKSDGETIKISYKSFQDYALFRVPTKEDTSKLSDNIMVKPNSIQKGKVTHEDLISNYLKSIDY